MSNLESNTSEQGVSTRILVGLIIGTLIGIVFNIWGTNSIRDGLLTYVFQPMGLAFLRGLFLVVVPLVLSSLIVGVANLGSAEHVRKLGGRLILFYISTKY